VTESLNYHSKIASFTASMSNRYYYYIDSTTLYLLNRYFLFITCSPNMS